MAIEYSHLYLLPFFPSLLDNSLRYLLRHLMCIVVLLVHVLVLQEKLFDKLWLEFNPRVGIVSAAYSG